MAHNEPLPIPIDAGQLRAGGRLDGAPASAGWTRRIVTRLGADLQLTAKSVGVGEAREEQVQADGAIRFCFRLSGDSTLEPGSGAPIRIHRPSLLVHRGPSGLPMIERYAAGIEQRSVEISMRRPSLLNGLLETQTQLPAELISLLQPCLNFVSCCIPLSAQLYQLATRLETRPMAGPLGAAYTEAITVELLCLALCELGSSAARAKSNASCSQRDVERLQRARTLIANNLTAPVTIRQLASVAALNETSLKRGSKALFGETVGQFSLRVRMEHALMLLNERHLSVARVADSVGYRHQSSFTAAFRRYFGVCPKTSRSHTGMTGGAVRTAQSR